MRAGYGCVRRSIALASPARIGRLICGVVALVIALAPQAVSLSAQSYQGGLRGVIKDAQGVIPGVEVALANQDTNAVRTALSNEAGEYSFTRQTGSFA